MEQQGINYLDLTGNALVRLDNPAVLIRSSGAARSPKPLERGKVRLRGPKAARVLRLLLDIRPPYGRARACHGLWSGRELHFPPPGRLGHRSAH